MATSYLVIIAAGLIFSCAFVVTSEAQCYFGSDDACIFPCRCNSSSDTCDRNSGLCQGRCEEILYGSGVQEDGLFRGPTCQIGNVAYGKRAYQSGVFDGLVANNAVNGIAFNGQQYCAHPDASSGNAYWAVDLGRKHRIFNVTIYNTQDGYGYRRLDDVKVATGFTENVTEHTECGFYNGPPANYTDDKHTINCDATGWFLSVQRVGGFQPDKMALCEVIVYGHVYNTVNESSDRCADWWFPEGQCFRHIRRLNIESDTTTPVLSWRTSDSINVTFWLEDNVDAGLESYYEYHVVYKKSTDTMWSDLLPSFLHTSNSLSENAVIGSLQPNTEYLIKVDVYRVHNGMSELISSNDSPLTVRTECTNPQPPAVEIDLVENGFTVRWTLRDSGCDDYMPMITVEYGDQRASFDTDVGMATIEVSPGDYVVEVLVENTDRLSTSSNPIQVTVSRAPVSDSDESTGGSDDPDVGLIAGVIVAFGVVIVAGLVVIFVLLRYRKKNNNKERKLEVISPFRIEHQGGGHVNSAFVGDRQASAPVTQKPARAPKPNLASLDPGYSEEYANVESKMNTEVKVEDLPKYIDEKLMEVDGFKREYFLLPQGAKAKHRSGFSDENIDKNRFKNIMAYDHSRVVLEMENNDPDSDYINANYLMGYKDVPHHYVATQGPKEHTIKDMWRMIWQLNSRVIIMITKLTENSKKKCQLYWPDAVGQSNTYEKITVRNVGTERFTDYTVRTFSLTKAEESRTVQHLQFTSWTDKSVPDHAFPLLSFRRKVRSLDDVSKGPMVVHCSAGVGRTGTFIAIDYLLEQARHEGVVDVYKCAFLMRSQRMNMVQTLEQYKFIYVALMDALHTGVTAVPSQNFIADLSAFTKPDQDGVSPMRRQFELLNADTEKLRDMANTGEYDREPYRSRNRDQTILPDDRYRPYLIRTRTRDDYINAVFVDNFKSKMGFIATQMPLPSTHEDIWRLLYDRASKTLVMLNAIDEADETCGRYWPEEKDSPKTYGEIQVTLVHQETSSSVDGLVVRDFRVNNVNKTSEEGMNVRQFELTSWPETAEFPANPDVILDLMETVEKWQQSSGNTSVTVHCMNGCRKSGLYCSAAYVIEKLKEEQEVDVFTSVRQMRLSRPNFIVDLAQYEYLHKIAKAYLARYETYANFK